MKFRFVFLFAFVALLLTACDMSLAQDVTPPPGAVQQVQPTHGPVFPAQAPDLQNGAAIYAEKCAPCHGDAGLGDGPQGLQLPVPVAALGSADVAAQASPADWFLVVTLGNMDNFMPPFASLSDQERWDVVAYAQSLSKTSEQISQGEQLFNENCADCPTDTFADQEKMAALSTNDLVNMLAEGGDGLPALGDTLSQDELSAVAAYLRTLTLGSSSLAAGPASTIETEIPAQEETPSTAASGGESPSAEGTPVGTEQADDTSEAPMVSIGFGSISGTVVNGSSGEAPVGVSVTLHGFEHSTDPNSTPQEVLTQTVETDANGNFTFEDVSYPEGRIFLAEVSYQDIVFQSDVVVVEAGMSEISIPEITVYDGTTDNGGLVVEQLHVSFDMAQEGGIQVFELFTISNLSDKAYIFATDGTSLPFMPLPEGASNVGLELSQDSAPLLATESGDLAIQPSENFYSIIAYFNLPYDRSLELTQSLALPVNSALVIVPEGIKVKSDQLKDSGTQQTQQGFNIQMYSGDNLNAGSPLEMTLSGRIGSAVSAGNSHTLLIGAGAFGVVLILAGVWMFLRDRDKQDDDAFEEGEEDEFESAEEVMDAIIALDDLHRANKIPDEAYQARRAELKARLKELA